jgi:DNA-binding transcriptional LysR family regulator
MSQSTLSRRIQELEEELGVRLFNRSRGLEPTEYGRLVLARAGGIVADVEDLKHTLGQMRGLEKGRLSIAVGELVANSWIGDAVARLLRRYPGLEVRVNQKGWWELTAALREREADIAVGQVDDKPAREPDIMFEPLPRRRGVFCCRNGHPLATRKKLSLDDLCAFPLAAPRLKANIAAVLPSVSQFGEIESNLRYFMPRICSSNFYATLRIVAQTDAIGYIFPSFATREIEEGSIVVLPFRPSWAVSDYGVIYLRGRTLPPSAVAFRAAAVSAENSYFDEDK